MSATRKSSRLQTKEGAITYAEPMSEDEGADEGLVASTSHTGATTTSNALSGSELSDDEFGDAASSSSKRKRKGKGVSKNRKRHRGKRGLLERMTELPMDLLFEIFGKLEPLDVLNLSRTTKELRAILLSRSSLAIWKECLQNTGVPERPEELNEPQWADLAFGKHCQNCGRAVAQRLMWDARVRACTRCIEESLFVSQSSSNIRDLNALHPNLITAVPTVELQSKGWRRRRMVTWYHKETIAKWTAELSQIDVGHDRDTFVNTKVKEAVARDEHMALCQEWFSDQLAVKEDKAASQRDDRVAHIIAKLEAAGFSDSVEDWLTTAIWHEKCVNDLLKKDITDRVWAGAKVGVLALASTYRQRRIERENSATIKTRHELFVQLHSDYVKSQPINAVIIPPADLFKIEEVKAIFRSVPFDQDLTSEHFNEIFAKMTPFTTTWVAETTLKLLNMARQHLETAFAPDPIPDNVLDLAVTARAFNCGCWRLDANQALAHRGRFYTYSTAAAVEDADVKLFGSNTNEHLWNENNHIEFDGGWFNRAKDVLQSLGYDFKTVTAEVMDNFDDIFECTTCTTFKDGREMLDWRSVLSHLGGPSHTYVKLDAETASIIRVRMKEHFIQARMATGNYPFQCTHCRFEQNGMSMRSHLVSMHNIANPTDADVTLLTHAKSSLRKVRYFDFGNTLF